MSSTTKQEDRASPVLWVGSYAAKGGRGLYPLSRASSGSWKVGEPYEEAQNASFGVRSARHQLQYLVDEQGGSLAIYKLEDGWKQLARLPTGGADPCYVALDATETRLAVANYGSGSVSLFSLDPHTGLPIGPPVVRANSGQGPNAERQEGPHAHCALFSPDLRWLYQTDLGTDQILAFPPDGVGEASLAFAAPPGSGPRHLILHPSRSVTFLISELASTLTMLDIEGSTLKVRQCLSTLPQGFDGENLGGHIGMNAAGDRLYVTNRGQDSLATFAFDGERLSLLQHVPSGGASPRFFLLLEAEKLMLVANEEGGNVTGFKILDDGTLEPAGLDVAVPGAVFIFAR